MNRGISFTLTSYLSLLINLSIFTFFPLARKALCVDPQFQACNVPKSCGDGQEIRFPFYIEHQQEPYCGYPGFMLSCNNRGNPVLRLPDNEYIVRQIFYNNQSLLVSNAAVLDSNSSCMPSIQNLSLPEDRFQLLSNHMLFLFRNCNLSGASSLSRYRIGCANDNETSSTLVLHKNDPVLVNASKECENGVVAPVDSPGGQIHGEPLQMLKHGFFLKWVASTCSACEDTGGKCGFNKTTYLFRCFCPDRPHASHCTSPGGHVKLELKLVIGFGALIMLIFVTIFSHFVLRSRYKKNHGSSEFLSRSATDPSSKSDIEGEIGYFGVSIFSFTELKEATNNFHSDKLIGDGGYGTVYHGKLRDGREVAVKRLYEHNSRRFKQFANEIEILKRLRHKNLVSLYGCTSERSSGLLLVYEFIPNGTVADHLHGDQAKLGSPTWPIRMSIAIQTASALAYLHASDVIHRDVKTDNILLDSNFCVKVADFGLSRLFPPHVTHVSTAPQGTAGYVDPEYYQCYQLTDKSDVYSFGVVLIELISSMPAVDINRHRDDINLANLAITKIRTGAFDELIDPNLGYKSDEEVRRMTVSVAELAFQCLQQDKEMRPTMDEVLEQLKTIQSGQHKLKESKERQNEDEMTDSSQPPSSPVDWTEVALLKQNPLPPSPDSVTEIWVSRNSTPNTSR